ncbi:MAG TPA: M48 family metallopeptidase [Gemmatimonadales bacterium]|nr:M48 family metallopeptidase [Gemmatimonadales bacterium]
MTDANLFAQQESNRRRSAVLVAIFVLFFAWIGFGADLILYLQTSGAPPGHYHHVIPFCGIAATLLALGMARAGWKSGAKHVLWATGAWELVTPSTPEEKQLDNIVEEMAIASGLPKPKIWIVPDDDPNAFATGTDERHAHIAVTQGLLKTLDRDELQAVIAHEMAHIRNYDVKLMTLLAALVGVLAIVSQGASRMIGFGGSSRSRSSSVSREESKNGGLIVVLLVAWIVSVLLAPLVSRLLALAVSRKREYLADASAAQFTRNPGALADALQKIESAAAPTKALQKAGSAHLCIADPMGRKVTSREGRLADLLATHPPMATRIARLRAMAYQYGKTGVMPESV